MPVDAPARSNESKPSDPFGSRPRKRRFTSRASPLAGVHPRKAFLMLTIKSGRSGTTQDIDGTLLGWLKQAHELCD